MKAITVRQPYASAIVLGLKNVENRTFSVPDGTWIAIHCSKHRPVRKLSDQELDCTFQKPDKCAGQVIGFARVKTCAEYHTVDSPWKQIVGKKRKTICWLLDKHLMLKPEKRFTCRGNLGLWNLSDDQVRPLIGTGSFCSCSKKRS